MLLEKVSIYTKIGSLSITKTVSIKEIVSLSTYNINLNIIIVRTCKRQYKIPVPHWSRGYDARLVIKRPAVR